MLKEIIPDNSPRSQYAVRVIMGNQPGEDEPYPLAIIPASQPHGTLDRAMSQYAVSGYQNLKLVTDAYIVV